MILRNDWLDFLSTGDYEVRYKIGRLERSLVICTEHDSRNLTEHELLRIIVVITDIFRFRVTVLISKQINLKVLSPHL